MECVLRRATLHPSVGGRGTSVCRPLALGVSNSLERPEPPEDLGAIHFCQGSTTEVARRVPHQLRWVCWSTNASIVDWILEAARPKIAGKVRRSCGRSLARTHAQVASVQHPDSVRLCARCQTSSLDAYHRTPMYAAIFQAGLAPTPGGYLDEDVGLSPPHSLRRSLWEPSTPLSATHRRLTRSRSISYSSSSHSPMVPTRGPGLRPSAFDRHFWSVVPDRPVAAIGASCDGVGG